ncbi:hypothetical protein [Marinobacterium lutimaris]|uniref:Group 4 capsule polysaccharide lipoprotein gfcB, YjbF n=1 Tax=Marinobacterium lutimaris TaxID=568106 RepID=A0A1H6DPS2_9GAMM|nr:hypothetical protein [Marinobacterium lutimaris]SEG87299.1 hypothetical protein SAMN05444390_10863 [Marinobacterium lutimaris]
MTGRRLLRTLVSTAVIGALLAGCAGKTPEAPVKPKLENSVTPKPLQVGQLQGYGQEQQLALALVSHYLGAPLYRVSNPMQISRDYRIGGAMKSPNGNQAVILFRALDDTQRWAMVTLSVQPGAVMNAFDVVRNGQPGYALVLKNARICTVEGADNPPVWGGSGWAFSQTGPGRFECSGQTKGSLYQSYSGMPGMMGAYAESGDTVLYDERWPLLQAVANGMAALFPNLQVPKIR